MERTIWSIAQAITLATVALAVGAVLLYMILMVPVLDSANSAAWVQAVGSIMAIVGAYLVGERQVQGALRSVREAQRLELSRKNASILGIAAEANRIGLAVAKAFEGGGMNSIAVTLSYDERLADDVVNALAALPFHDLGSYEAVTSLFRLKNEMVKLQGAVADARQHRIKPVTEDQGRIAEYERNTKGRAHRVVAIARKVTLEFEKLEKVLPVK